MKSVAFFGFSKSTGGMIHQSKADEIWSVNWAWQYDVPRIDRLFDLHPRWHLEAPGDLMEEHWAWLREPHDFPIYTLYDPSKLRNKERELNFKIKASAGIMDDESLEKWERMVQAKEELEKDIEFFYKIPAAVPYPIGDVINNIGRKYFASTVSYMLGLALLEGFDRIELYGIDMASSTEYAYQKASAEYLIGVAEGRGVEVYIPDKSKLMRGALYGYDGGFQMISRQTLEKIRQEYKKQFEQNRSDFEQAKGAWEVLRKLTDDETDDARKRGLISQTAEAYKQFLLAKNGLIALDSCMQVMTHLIDEVDLKVPNLEIKSNMAVQV